MPTGVTVSRSGRIFVNFPRWGDAVEYTVAEVRNGQTVAYPNAGINRLNQADPSKALVSVQSVVMDPRNRLWILDTGSINFAPSPPGAAKLVGVDIQQNRVFKAIVFPRDVVLPTTYLNDVRFDLRRGTVELLANDPRMLWPDTLSLAQNGYLYFTANQLHRQARFHNGKDLRQKPYSLFRIRTNGQPVTLR